MKKLFPTTATGPSFVYLQSARAKACVFGALILLTSCTATQTRWDATNIRKEVMVYYNDQIMDNLIRAKNQLPFVHVDITLLTSQGSSQISGTAGYGETITNTSNSARTNQITTTDTTNTGPPATMHSVATIAGGLLATASHAAMRPFAYSVTPQQTETLSIQAAPALGSQAIASMSGPVTITKETDETDTNPGSKMPTIDTENDAKKPTPTPTPIARSTPSITTKVTTEKTRAAVVIYELYDCFAQDPRTCTKHCKEISANEPIEDRRIIFWGHLSHSPTEPPKGAYVTGTLKKGPTPEGGVEYYFIAVNDRKAYYEFCKKLFIKGQSQVGGLERALQQTQAAAALPLR